MIKNYVSNTYIGLKKKMKRPLLTLFLAFSIGFFGVLQSHAQCSKQISKENPTTAITAVDFTLDVTMILISLKH